MKRLLPGVAALLLPLVSACSDTAELPPIEVGGPSGVRLMNGQARTPLEAYDQSYSTLGRSHRDVQRNLEPRGRNLVGAEAALQGILNALQTMRAMAAPGERPRFDPYLARYRDFLRDVERNTWGGSFLSSLDQCEREIKSNFHPKNVDILADFPTDVEGPAARPAAKAQPAAPATDDPAVPTDKVEAPLKKSPAAPAAPPAANPADKPAAAAPAPAPAASPRIYFKAWDRSHDELVEAFKAKKDCRTKYEDLTEALRLLKAQHSGEKAAKLQIYVDYYGAIHDKTKGFTALPEKTSEKDIVDELDVAARVIRKEFNPEK